MKIHYLVEGQSEAALLSVWLKRALPGHTHNVYPHEGKGNIPKNLVAPPNPMHRGLLDQLPAKLQAYGKSLDPATDRVLVLVDADNENCVQLKNALLKVLNACSPRPHALIRIAVEETEAFYLGDKKAVKSAFSTFRHGPYQNYVQDSVCGTWEVFQQVVGWKYEAKVKWASMVAEHLGTVKSGQNLNRSPSFRAFYKAVCALAGESWP